MSRQRSMEAILASDYVSIGELVRLTESRYSTLKHYTEEGMLPYEQEEQNLTRRYKREETVARIQQIKEWKAQGLSIPQIKEELRAN
ncbi:helix-turn-helix domain-containing protein [Paenibacillus aquistagni]|uniref:MerR HTH family regulatory protein n=1 Tax=Paenibacillus aquistagni TaxID=1852522 RepID=A0A1X7K3B0_9BACL|nr:helix-turn-helix domain-containing protein [Paenibacillus aquistagni]SMG34650.1 MerR HTH family regulatory protein [Paenibacillus aquistagni]